MNKQITWLLVALATLCARAQDTKAEPDLVLSAPEGWSLREAPKRFDADNLYTVIDGEADMFLPYHLQYALFADYVQTASSPMVSVDIYKMGSALDAFGIYSLAHSKNVTPVDIGTVAVRGSTQILFCKGAYFGRVTSSQKSDAATRALELCARTLAKTIPDDATAIPELKWLRVGGLIAGTEQYFAKDLLDLPFLKRGLTADVKCCDTTARIFLMPADSEEQAISAYAAFEAYLASRNTKPIRDPGAGDVLLVHDADLKGMAVIRSRTFIVGVCQLDDPRNALPLLKEMIAQLPPPTTVPAKP